jgi:hypothetical protein
MNWQFPAVSSLSEKCIVHDLLMPYNGIDYLYPLQKIHYKKNLAVEVRIKKKGLKEIFSSLSSFPIFL